MKAELKNLSQLLAVSTLALVAYGCDRSPPGPLEILEIDNAAAPGSAEPHLSVGGDGTTVLSWIEPRENADALMFSTYDGGSWSPARTVVEGTDWFVSWADPPSVVPILGDLWAAHWMRNQPDSYFALDVVFALSTDAGATWQTPEVLHRDGTESEHGFVSLFPQQGQVAAVWLDGRNYIQDGVYLYEDADGNLLGTGLHYAQYAATGERLDASTIDDMVCDCCLPDVALTSDGPVVAYRDRTVQEKRDIVVRRMQDNQWQAALALSPDNWVIEACPINGPTIAASGDDVVVAWFSAPEDEPHVRIAQSFDAGRSFSPALEIDAAGSFGYVDVVLIDSGDAIVSWFRREADGISLSIRRVYADGQLGEIQSVAFVDIGRPADFPQMVYANDQLIFAWTDFEGAGSLKTAVAELSR
jgi:hypothetical protein